MQLIAAGWRRFRGQPTAVQVATWAALAALYTGVLFALFGGGDDPARPKPLSALERQVSGYVNGVQVRGTERTDVPAFRQPRVREVSCRGEEACEVTYSVGLPGTGRILEDQRKIWSTIFSETAVDRLTLTVVRGFAVGKGTPLKQNEETVGGQPLLTTTCDRSKAGDITRVDWKHPDAVNLFAKVCSLEKTSQGRSPTRTTEEGGTP